MPGECTSSTNLQLTLTKFQLLVIVRAMLVVMREMEVALVNFTRSEPSKKQRWLLASQPANQSAALSR